jgi:hypothetical protein
LGVKQTSQFEGVMSAFDPKRTWGAFPATGLSRYDALF